METGNTNNIEQPIIYSADEETLNYLEKLLKDPDRLKKTLSSVERKEEIDSFKQKFSATHSTPLRCPACRETFGGALWRTTNKDEFVCRKCETVFYVECKTLPNDELLLAIKKATKENITIKKAIEEQLNIDEITKR